MNNQADWPRIAVVGAGAVGSYFGGMLARAGASVVLIGRPGFVEEVQHNGLFLDTLQFQEAISIEATTSLSVVQNADIILMSVKTTDIETIGHQLARLISPKTIIVSLQNGPDSAERIRAVCKTEVLPAAVYIAVSMLEPGRIKHSSRGDLVIGPSNDITKYISAVFKRASITCRISDNIEGELWTKLVWNCSVNAISALGHVTYGKLIANPDGLELLINIVDEVMSVARAAGIHPVGLDQAHSGNFVAQQLAKQMPDVMSSTARDLANGRITEIDSLNGYVVRRGKALGVPTPVNHALYTLVKLAENRSDL